MGSTNPGNLDGVQAVQVVNMDDLSTTWSNFFRQAAQVVKMNDMGAILNKFLGHGLGLA